MDQKTNSPANRDNLVRIDFGAHRRNSQAVGKSVAYGNFAPALPPTLPPLREVTNLSLRRDEVLGESLTEIAGVDCGNDTVNVALALNGRAPNERWLKQLVITVHDEVTGFKIGAPVATVTPSETGGFIHLKSLPFKGVAPTTNDVSWGTIVRISGPRGWRLQAALAEMNWFNVP